MKCTVDFNVELGRKILLCYVEYSIVKRMTDEEVAKACCKYIKAYGFSNIEIDTNSTEFAPCPKCGAKIAPLLWFGVQGQGFHYICKECNYSSPWGDNKSEAKKNWNEQTVKEDI